jgi:serine/threonine protein kinase
MAPEIMNGDNYTSKVDVWSLGTMVYELLVGFAPFTGTDPHDLAQNINNGQYGVPKNIKLSLD